MAIYRTEIEPFPPENSLIEQMKRKLQEQDEILKELTALPLGHATIVSADPKALTATIAVNGGEIVEVNLPSALKSATPGTPVLINGKTKQIVRKSKSVQVGGIGVVKALINDHMSEVIIDGQNKAVVNGETTPKVGDSVVMSAGNMVIYAVMPQEKGQRFVVESLVDVKWNQIGGQRAAKAALQEAIVLPAMHPDIFRFYGKSFPGGVLLFGPPGNGKTMLGKASATAIRGKGAKGAFFSIKGPEVLDAYVGETERKIRDLFKAARRHKKETGDPAVIFIDEAEALLSARGGRGFGMEKTVVPTFLAEMDGIEESSAIVMLATNRPEQLDPAIVRDGRMDRKIEVTRPTAEDAAEIVAVYLDKAPIDNAYTRPELGAMIVDQVYTKAVIAGSKRPLREAVSGAMLAGIVEHAKSFALQRDLANKPKRPSGIGVGDVANAVLRIAEENGRITHAA